MSILALIVFVVMFSILILVHELGHFWAARRAGVKVEEFGLGLPPRILGRKKGDTLYSLNWIPFGGFVKLHGEGAEAHMSHDSLQNKSYGQRFLVITGGVLMNFILGYAVIMIGMWLSMPPLAADVDSLVADSSQIDRQVIILGVEEGTPADKAGVLAGDVVTSINGAAIGTVDDFRAAVATAEEVSVEIVRDGATQTLQVPTYTREDGSRVVGVFSEEMILRVSYEWWKVPYFALIDTGWAMYRVGDAVVDFVGGLLATGKIDEAVSGPVGIAQITAYAVGLGIIPVLQLLAFLSINLGLINLLPFPALDGGRLMFLIIEVLMGGRRVKPIVENVIHNLGFALLLILIGVVTYRDIVKLF